MKLQQCTILKIFPPVTPQATLQQQGRDRAGEGGWQGREGRVGKEERKKKENGDRPPSSIERNLVHISDFYRAMHFSAKRGIAIECRLSVCLSVCL